MREIKFRGKYDFGKRWLYGDLRHIGNIVCIYSGTDANVGSTVAPATVGQYTGLKDSEGEEIYEGDIVTFERGTEPSAVRWDNEFAYFVIMKSLPLGHACKAVRVIGNIHDNPELLEMKNARD